VPALAPDSARRRRAYSQMMIGVSFPRLAVRGIDVVRHPGLTLTVADPQRFAATASHYAGLPAAAGTASA